jgi:CBS domain-containing protein
MTQPSDKDAMEFEDPLSNYDPLTYESELERALAEETLEAMQIQPCIEIGPSDLVQDAIQILHDTGISSLLVVENDRLVGIFTERDVLERVAEQYDKLASVPVREVMTVSPTVVYGFEPAAAAVSAIAVAGHRHVPVLGADDSVLGVVSPRRVMKFIDKHL